MQLVRIVTHHKDPRTAAELFASEGVAAIGWSSLGDLRGKTREEIKNLMKKRWKSSEQESARRTSELLTLRDKVKNGNIVFAYIRDNTIALVGEVVAGYSFNNRNKVGNEDGPVGYPHQIKVKWRDAPRYFSRFSLPDDLLKWVALRGTISVRDYESPVLEQALRKLSGKDNAQQMKSDSKPGVGRAKRRRAWSREEVILALALFKTPESSWDEEDPQVQALARLLNRTADAVILKKANLRAVETGGKAGLSHIAPMDQQVWREFQGRNEELFQEAERIRAQMYSRSREVEEEQIRDDERRILDLRRFPTERFSPTRVRQQTDALRRIVLRDYGEKCSFCDLDIVEMLEVAHIHGWTEDEENRLNPSNTLCLCVLHHRAFDKGLISVTPNGLICVSSHVKKSSSGVIKSMIVDLDTKQMRFSQQFRPNLEFLSDHQRNVFRGL